MNRIVHVQTNIQTILGVLDDDGNVVQKQPLNVEVGVLSINAFTEAVNALLKAKSEAQEKLNINNNEKVGD